MPAHPPRVLIVDDFEDGLDLYVQYLRHLGWVVETAVDGAEAIATARRTRPDLVIMDLGLPGIDGYEATRRLRRMAKFRNLPIVALSGFVHEDSINRAMASGCTLFLARPVLPDELARKIEEILAQTPPAPEDPVPHPRRSMRAARTRHA